MSTRTWDPHPLPLSIVERLERKGALTDVDLLDEMKEIYGDISFRELNKTLMRLEVTGSIRVTRLMKGKRQVELAHSKR